MHCLIGLLVHGHLLKLNLCVINGQFWRACAAWTQCWWLLLVGLLIVRDCCGVSYFQIILICAQTSEVWLVDYFKSTQKLDGEKAWEWDRIKLAARACWTTSWGYATKSTRYTFEVGIALHADSCELGQTTMWQCTLNRTRLVCCVHSSLHGWHACGHMV